MKSTTCLMALDEIDSNAVSTNHGHHQVIVPGNPHSDELHQHAVADAAQCGLSIIDYKTIQRQLQRPSPSKRIPSRINSKGGRNRI